MTMSCGCIAYPCLHSQLGGQGQMQQHLYNEMMRKYGQMQNMHSIQQAVNPNEKKVNKKLLLLRK